MAGVAGHSGYKGDPWGRLQRTSHYLAVTTFGTIADAEKAIEHVRSVHRRVRGTDELGRPYAADDPHLLRWVHVAEIWSFLNAYQAYAAEPLTAGRGRPLRHADQPRRLAARRDRPADDGAGARRGHRRLPPRAGEHGGRARGDPLHAAEPAGPAGRPPRLRADRRRRGRAAARPGPAVRCGCRSTAPASPSPRAPAASRPRWCAGGWPASTTAHPVTAVSSRRAREQRLEPRSAPRGDCATCSSPARPPPPAPPSVRWPPPPTPTGTPPSTSPPGNRPRSRSRSSGRRCTPTSRSSPPPR